MRTINRDTYIEIPTSLVVCPICGQQVTVEIDEWEQNADGTWQAGECGVHCSCVTEPDLDDDTWDDWFNGHWSTPYADWLPVDEKVRRWLNRHYRFALVTMAS